VNNVHIAIVDVGSNNIKLEIFELNSEGHSHLVFAEKFQARLGSDVFLTRKLRSESVEIAVEALKQIRRITQEFKCKQTVAIATAALRECESSDFIERVKRESGITVHVISGLEEARFVYNGVRAHTSLGDKNYFINDIGGGSTEILVASDQDIHFVESLRLGTVRLREMFASEAKDLVKLIDRYVARSVEPYLADIARYKPEAGLCTGGTARTLLEVLREMGVSLKEELRLPCVDTRDFADVVDQLSGMSKKELARLKSIDEGRRDIILPGAALLLSLLRHTKLSRFLVSPNGLRDGALADYVYNKVNKNIYLRSQTQFREAGLTTIVDKYKMDREHSQHVANLAVQIFDIFTDVHRLPPETRDLLKAAAMLHDIGKFIDYSQHHKHALYILSNMTLPGYNNDERDIIAHTARYHRKSNPKASHLEYEKLTGRKQEIILKLSVMLRLADSLDRSYSSSIIGLKGQKIDARTWRIEFDANADSQMEKWAFNRKKEFFEKIFDTRLELA
jgi:exopolyphosphatase / guanosine-5'-triphosphate,3'-diphosphate pyrophosphatase